MINKQLIKKHWPSIVAVGIPTMLALIDYKVQQAAQRRIAKEKRMLKQAGIILGVLLGAGILIAKEVIVWLY